MKSGQIFKRVCADELYSQELCERRWKNKELVVREKKNQSYGFIIYTKESNWVASKIISELPRLGFPTKVT